MFAVSDWDLGLLFPLLGGDEVSAGLELKISTDDGSLLVQLIGRISYTESNEFQTKLDELLLKDERKIVFDCTELSFISSAGLRAILQLAKQAPTEDRKLVFYGLQENVAHIFDISGFTKILKIYSDKEQAVSALAESA